MDPNQFEAIIQEAASTHGLDPELIRSIIHAESSFNPGAVSPTGAMGLMQLMPPTARMLGVENAFDPRQNIMGGAGYLSKLLNQFGGDRSKALAAYNAGPGRVSRGGPLPSETSSYVQKVLARLGGARPPAMGVPPMPGQGGSPLPTPAPAPAPAPPPMPTREDLSMPMMRPPFPGAVPNTGASNMMDYIQAPNIPDMDSDQELINDAIAQYGMDPRDRIEATLSDGGDTVEATGDMPIHSSWSGSPMGGASGMGGASFSGDAGAGDSGVPENWGPAGPSGWQAAGMYGIPALTGIASLLVGGGRGRFSDALGGFAKGFAQQSHAKLEQDRAKRQDMEKAAFDSARKNFEELQTINFEDLQKAGVGVSEIEDVKNVYQLYSNNLADGKITPKESAEMNRIWGQISGRIAGYKARQQNYQTQGNKQATLTGLAEAAGMPTTGIAEKMYRDEFGYGGDTPAESLQGLTPGQILDLRKAKAQEALGEGRLQASQERVAQGWARLDQSATRDVRRQAALANARGNRALMAQVSAIFSKIDWYAYDQGDPASHNLMAMVDQLLGVPSDISGRGAPPEAMAPPPGAAPAGLPTPPPSPGAYTGRRIR